MSTGEERPQAFLISFHMLMDIEVALQFISIVQEFSIKANTANIFRNYVKLTRSVLLPHSLSFQQRSTERLK